MLGAGKNEACTCWVHFYALPKTLALLFCPKTVRPSTSSASLSVYTAPYSDMHAFYRCTCPLLQQQCACLSKQCWCFSTADDLAILCRALKAHWSSPSRRQHPACRLPWVSWSLAQRPLTSGALHFAGFFIFFHKACSTTDGFTALSTQIWVFWTMMMHACSHKVNINVKTFASWRYACCIGAPCWQHTISTCSDKMELCPV